ncbi:MAG: restriction endonuclease [Erysipelotrichaceae bacterium]|nr:restriction endonuclease [Erysipelotrichaceae bacterium]
MKIILKIILIPFKIIGFILKKLFGFIFGWISELDDDMTGEEFEQYVAEILKYNRYTNIELTKHTGDYGIDILANYQGYSYAIQCKMYHKPVGIAAIQQAYAGYIYYDCDYPIVVTNNQFTQAARELAQTNNVILWDGNYLEKLRKRANRHSIFHHYHENDEEEKDDDIDIDPDIKQLLKDNGFASIDLLVSYMHISKEEAQYILDDLEFKDYISSEDEHGIREIYF